MRAQKSVILITVDCLRADHVGFMGYARATTPFLDGLASGGLVIPKAMVTGAPTYYSFPGIMASRYPLALGRGVVGIAPGEPTLATILQQAGYSTAGFVAGNPYLSKRFGYGQGFDVFQDFLPKSVFGPDETAQVDSEVRALTRFNRKLADAAHRAGPLGRLYDELYFQYRHRIAASKASWDRLRRFPAANVLVDHACDWLNTVGREPFFLWLHFMDPHAPYYPVPDAIAAMGVAIHPGRGLYLNAAWQERTETRARKYRDEIVSLYDAGIWWVDRQLSRLVERLRVLSQWDSSVLALTADHGEEFLDHGGRFHYPSRAFQELLHVPLLLRVPGMEMKVRSDAPISQLHLAPTLLDAVGMESPAEFEGQSILRTEPAPWSVSESIGKSTNPMEPEKRMFGRVLAVQDRRFKLIVDFDENSERLFDLEKDPGETQALTADVEKAARVRLLRYLSDHLARPAKGPNRERALRARVREVGIEWKHSKMKSKTLAS